MPRPVSLLVLLALALASQPAFSADRSGQVSQLARARLDAARATYQQVVVAQAAGLVDADTVYRWSVRWYDAERGGKKNSVAARAHLARMQALSSKIQALVAAGAARQSDALAATYYKTEAELWEAESQAP